MSDSDKTMIGKAPVSAAVKLCLHSADGKVLDIGDELFVGRGADCGLVLNDDRISRKHAVLRQRDGQLSVEDLGSTNGTHVNGQKIQAATLLSAGDKLGFEQHSFNVALAGQPVAVAVDATVIGVAPDKPAPPRAAAVPGSWVEGGAVDGTQILSAGAVSAVDRGAASRASDLPHLLLYEGGGNSKVIELPVGGTDEADVWELGRDQACEVCLADSAVSMRHAQLIHQAGRWKLVNLVSTNGIFVNDEKKLTAYLSVGDRLRLGKTELVFFPAEGVGQAATPGKDRVASSAGATTGSSSSKLPLIIIGALLVVGIAVGIWFVI